MNPRDELIRRAMLHATPHVSRPGYAVGGKPGESAMARAEATRGTSASAGNVGGIRDGGFGGAGVGSLGGGGGGNAIGSVGGIRDGGFGGAGVMNQPSANATYKGQNVNISPASDMLTPDQFDALKRDLIQMQAASTPTGFRGTPGSQTLGGITPKSFPSTPVSAGAVDPTGSVLSYSQLGNAIMGNTMGSPYNNVIQYGSPVTGVIQDLPGALRKNPLKPSAPTRYHAGVDIAAAPGSSTVSMVPGKIAQLGTGTGYGSFVDIMNYDGTISRYATHAGIDPSLQVGSNVSKGQVLGTSGAMPSGNFSHLHLEQLTPSDRAFQDIAAAYKSGATAARPASPGNVAGQTSSYDKGNILSSTQNLLDRLGLKTGSKMAMGQDLTPAGLPAKTAIASSGFPSFDRLTTVPSYSAVGNALMGDTVNSPYNNMTQSFYDALSPSAPSYGELANVAMGSTIGSPYNNIAKSAKAAPVVAGAGPQSITPLGFQNVQQALQSAVAPQYTYDGTPANAVYKAPAAPQYVYNGTPANAVYKAPAAPQYVYDGTPANAVYKTAAQPPAPTQSIAETVAKQAAINPTADMPSTMKYVPMAPRPTTPPPANANFFQKVANAMLPENLFPNALYTQPTPPGQYLVQSPENMGLLSGYMSEPFRIDRDIGVATIPTTGMPNPNANVITTSSGRQLAFNPASGSYEYVSRFDGSLDNRPGGDNRERAGNRTTMKLLLDMGYTRDEINAMSPEERREILNNRTETAATGGRIGYKRGGSSESKNGSSTASTTYGPATLPELPAFVMPQMPTYPTLQASPMISNFVNAMSQPIPPAPVQQYQSMVSPLQNWEASYANPAMGSKAVLPNAGVNALRYNPMLMDERPDYALTTNDSLSNALRLARG